ncbi:MAG TPA: tetratricopeptide repeat protein [Hyphomonadaceae bacterium]|nr:tetratricopeptide repeat protein [Hyphomonadaceae bacterium]
MWSGLSKSGSRAKLVVASVCLLGGCAIAPTPPSWFSGSVFEEITNSEEYADFLAARYAGMSGQPVAAAGFYRRAFERSPGDPALLERAAFAMLISGETQGAVAVAQAADPKVATQAPTAQLALVIDDITMNRGKRALQRLKTTNLGGINGDIAGYLTAWLTAADNADQGLALLAQLPARRVSAAEQLCIEGLIELQAGRDDKALEAFAQASKLPSGAQDIIAGLHAQLVASSGRDLAAARQLVLAQVEKSGATSETDRMLTLLEAGEPAPRPKFTLAEGAAFIVYVASSSGVARSSPEMSTMRNSLVLRLNPDYAPARLALADALKEEERAEDAIAVLHAVPAGSPWSAEARLQEAWLLDGLHRSDEAMAAAAQALVASHRRDILVGVADLDRLNGSFADAKKIYDEIAAADLSSGQADWRILFARATASNGLGDWKGAEKDLVAALALEPDRPELQNYLGYAWVERGEKVKEGMDLIRKAAAARPDQGYIVDSLGWAHYRLGEYDEAVDNLEHAAELSPSDPEVIDHLGDAYWRAGRETEAQFEWRRALKLGSDAKRKANLREKLDKGLPPRALSSLADAQRPGQ